MTEPPPLTQLVAFADYELMARPPEDPEQQHIAHWAAAEIERLMFENEELKAKIRELENQDEYK